jgi:hypothetical protein
VAHTTLAVLSCPAFPQAVIDAALDRILAIPKLGTCCYESPETSWGAGDGVPCTQTAIVHDLASELEFCAAHFARVSGVRRG